MRAGEKEDGWADGRSGVEVVVVGSVAWRWRAVGGMAWWRRWWRGCVCSLDDLLVGVMSDTDDCRMG